MRPFRRASELTALRNHLGYWSRTSQPEVFGPVASHLSSGLSRQMAVLDTPLTASFCSFPTEEFSVGAVVSSLPGRSLSLT